MYGIANYDCTYIPEEIDWVTLPEPLYTSTVDVIDIRWWFILAYGDVFNTEHCIPHHHITHTIEADNYSRFYSNVNRGRGDVSLLSVKEKTRRFVAYDTV